jgi:F-type H+-transporting ATPase subunit epsilon
MGVYPNHIPLTTVLAPCVLKVHEGEDVKKIEISGGFAEILKDRITVLAESAEWK